jgi:hypothetical protein
MCVGRFGLTFFYPSTGNASPNDAWIVVIIIIVIIGEAGSVFHIGEDYIAQTINREVSGLEKTFCAGSGRRSERRRCI